MSVSHLTPTAAIVTLGCKVNQYESEAIAEGLVSAGFSMRPSHEVCDLYVVNTCTVTSESDRKARQMIRHLIGQNPHAFMIVTGCTAQVHADQIAAIAGVDAIVGNRDKQTVIAVAKQLIESGEKPATPLVEVPELKGSRFEPMTITHFDRTRAYVKIQDGCESNCTYCAIPKARGPLRSKPVDDVLREVTDLTARGCREIVLTGIETGSWGMDLGKQRLQDLLEQVDRIEGLGRIRLGSLDPVTMSQRFVDSIARLDHMAPHFHLSMQSGCSATLTRMHRRYNAGQAAVVMARVRAAIPDVQFTTDMIVGFPGETEAEFAESMAFAREAEFLHIHVFPYSRRDGTPAAAMKDQIPEAIKKARVAALSAVSAESCAAILDRALLCPDPLPVLLESHEKGCMFGHTPSFMEVRVESPADRRGQEVLVRPVARDGEVLVGEIVGE